MDYLKQSKPLAVSKVRKRQMKPVIVPFSSPTPNIPQLDLMEERVLFQKALRAVEKWQERSRQIQTAIEAGGSVEPGIYKADVIEQECESPLGFTYSIVRLLVR